MVLKNHTTIDKLMLETAKDRSEIIEYVTKNMERKLVEAMLDNIEPGKDYLIKLHKADYYEDFGKCMCGYKAALEVNGWTPCSERLPDYDTLILFCATYDNKTSISISKGSLVRDWHKTVKDAAWMPLPEPYKEM